jgi:hypothetical protein
MCNCLSDATRFDHESLVYSKRDAKKIRRTFPTKAAAVAWRSDSASAVRKKLMRAPTSMTLREAANAWLEGARAGVIRNRSGDTYKPSAIRGYDQGLRLRVLPELGDRKLSDISRTDLQDLVDDLTAAGLNASTIVVTLLPGPRDLQAHDYAGGLRHCGEPDDGSADARRARWP